MRKEEVRLQGAEVRGDKAGGELAWRLGLPALILEPAPDCRSLIRLPLIPEPLVPDPWSLIPDP